MIDRVQAPAQRFQRYSEEGERLLSRLREVVTAPEQVKRLRIWGIQEAAKMIGRTPQSIRQLEGTGKKLGEPTKDDNGHRYYTLSRINWIRDQLGTRYQRPKGSRTIRAAISNFKGGSAKTTTCLHLGQRCALDGLRTLVIDLDPQATLTLFFGLMPDLDVDPDETITDTLVSNPQMLRDVIRPTYFTGIDLVPANLALQDAEIALANPVTNNDRHLGTPVGRLAAALDTIEDQYDVILFDCGPNLGLLTLNAVYAASGLVIPMQPAMADFGSSVLFCQTMATLLGDSRFNKPLEFLRVLITRHTGTAEAKNTEAMIRLAFGQDVLENVMVQTVEIERAANDFGSVYEIQQPRGSADAYSRAVAALHAVNGEIIEMFKRVWERQAREQSHGRLGEVAHA